MRRGDVVIAAAQGEYGKPRPAVVVQSDVVQQFDTVALALLTTTGIEAPAIRPIIALSASDIFSISPTSALNFAGTSTIFASSDICIEFRI